MSCSTRGGLSRRLAQHRVLDRLLVLVELLTPLAEYLLSLVEISCPGGFVQFALVPLARCLEGP